MFLDYHLKCSICMFFLNQTRLSEKVIPPGKLTAHLVLTDWTEAIVLVQPMYEVSRASSSRLLLKTIKWI